MADMYVFGRPNETGFYSYNEEEEDYSTTGLVGALVPLEPKFKAVANGESTLTFKHPIDEYGRYKALIKGNIIVAPVPVRITPEIEDGRIVTTVYTYRVKDQGLLTSKSQRQLFKKKTGSGKKGLLKFGEKVTVVSVPIKDGSRWKVKSRLGTGWINPDGFEYEEEHVIADNSQSIEEVQSFWRVMPQRFRILEPKKTIDSIEITARHISYDLLKNMTWFESNDEIQLQDALDQIMEQTYGQHSFTAKTNSNNARAALRYKRRNLIDVFLNPEDGVCKMFDVNLVVDDEELYFLHDPGVNRGVRIEYGKNMLGVECTLSDDNVVTRIVPVGEKKDGTDLLLSEKPEEQYIDSPLFNNYPIPHIYELKVDDAKVGDKEDKGGKVDRPTALKRMSDAARKLFAEKVDEPTITMSVEYRNLGDTEEYSQFAGLEDLFLFDYVSIKHPDMNIDLNARVVEIEWDVDTERMDKIVVGEITKNLANGSIPGWSISGGLNGNKLLPQSVGGNSVQFGSIYADHIQAYSIVAEHIAAGSITARTIAVDALYAQHIVSQVATIIEANIMQASIGSAHIDYADIVNLDALIGNIANARIGQAHIDVAQIYDLSVGNAIIQKGIGDKFYFADLAVTDANMLNLTLGYLMLKGPDGRFYRIFPDESGGVASEIVQVAGDNIANNTITGGNILENTITAREINVHSLMASEAMFGQVVAAHLAAGIITVDKLHSTFASDLDLSSNQSIRMQVNEDAVWAMVEDGTRMLRIDYDGAGTHFKDDNDTTTLTASVWAGNRNITASVPVQAFSWKRISVGRSSEIEGEPPEDLEALKAADDAWTAQHQGMRQVPIRKADINARCIFECTLYSQEEMAINWSFDPETGVLIATYPDHSSDYVTYDQATGMMTIYGEGYEYDPATGKIRVASGISSERMTAQYTFSDETGVRSLIMQTKDQIILLVDNTLQDQESRLDIKIGQIQSTVADKVSQTQLTQTANSLSVSINSVDTRVTNNTNSLQSQINSANSNIQFLMNNQGFTFKLSESASSSTYMQMTNRSRYWKFGPAATTRMSVGLDVWENGTYAGAIHGSGYFNALAVSAYYQLILDSGAYGASLNLQYDSTAGPGLPMASCYGHWVPASWDDDNWSIGTRGAIGVRRWKNVNITGSVDNSSDRREKANIAPIDEEMAIYLLDHLSPSTFTMLSDGYFGRTRFGFIAQDVRDVFKEIEEILHTTKWNHIEFYKGDDPDHLSIAYSELIAVLVFGYQHLKQLINNQNGRLKTLESLMGVTA